MKDENAETLTQDGRQELLLTAQRNSEVMTGEYPSSMSIDPTCQAEDSVSHSTEVVREQSQGIKAPDTHAPVDSVEYTHNSGKIRVQDEQPQYIGEDISSFMTPRPGLTSGLIKRETVVDASDRVRLERSSIDTDVRPALPAHIQHSKGNRRPPAGSKR